MLTKPNQNMSIMLVAVFILLLVGMAQHFHSLNSYHDGNDCYHVSGIEAVAGSFHDIAADAHKLFAYTPVLTEGKLIPSSFLSTSHVLFIDFLLSRAPPA